jgi:hypothetical protein
MPCDPIRTSSGVTGIVCSGRGRKPPVRFCSICNVRRGTLECDGKKPKRKSGTCDRLMCNQCSRRGSDQVLVHSSEGRHRDVIDTSDYCPDCWKELERQAKAPKQGELF